MNAVDFRGIPLWKAPKNAYGPGSVHVVDTCGEKTVCGRRFAAIVGGEFLSSGTAECQNCLSILANREKQRQLDDLWQVEAERKAAEKAREKKERRALYDSHLRSDAWKGKRAAVLERARGICEGCGLKPPADVHHLTYDHLGDEFLWELRAVCRDCHKRVHGIEDECP